jgi:hypothetical protein
VTVTAISGRNARMVTSAMTAMELSPKLLTLRSSQVS